MENSSNPVNIEMTYRTKYAGALFINGKEYSLTDDSLYIINSKSIHEIHTFPQQEMSAILVSIPYEFIKALVPDVDFYFFVTGKNEKNMKLVILKMKECIENKGENTYLLMHSLALELIYYMMEDAEPLSISSDRTSDGRSILLSSEIIAYLRNNISTVKTVDDLSTALGYSREHLSRSVSNHLGISCKSLIDQIRLDYAVYLMKNSQDSLSQLAEKSGFPSYRNFRTIFQKYYGCKPGSFRNR